MAYEPLHHKYRPQTFGDLVGQKTISLTLINALKQGKIAPAYLFTGPRGTGKTSSARILAKSLNCLGSDLPTPDPCGKCEACLAIAKGSALDVMEIDAASNTGVDNIREIIERSRFAPVQCRYKIYVIDECHMLSTAAFNALLKTLEEPPSQVVFILATTDPQRVLSTIISRCQRFDYRRIPLGEMVSHLKYIAQAEAIAIADEALTLVAQIANGGLRDAESLLDQLSLLPETITIEKVWDLVGAVPEQDLLKLLRGINQNDSLAVLQQCRSLLDRGREPLVVLQNLATFYLNLLIAKTAPQHSELTAVTETCWQQLCNESQNWQTTLILWGQQQLKDAEVQLKRTTQPRLWLEVTLLGLLPEAHSAITVAEATVKPKTLQQVVTEPSNVATVANTPPAVPQNNSATSAIASQQNQVATSTPIQSEPPLQKPIEPSSSSLAPPNKDDPAYPATEVVSETSTVEPKSVTSRANQDPAANQQIWNQVVSRLHPPTTQALLKQQCHLISFDGLSAVVGVSSAKLQKMTQQKIPNIEAAFAQVCQHKVRVQLEVASSQNKVAKNPTTPINQPVRAIPQPEESPQPPPPKRTQVAPQEQRKAVQSPSLENHARSPNSGVKSLQHHQVTNQPPETGNQNTVAGEVPGKNNQAFPPETAVTKSETTSETNHGDNELEKAIANLTQSFEGEVVKFDDREDTMADDFTDTESSTDLETTIPLERPNLEEYDDEW